VTFIPSIGAAVGPIVAVLLGAALLSYLLTPRVRRVVLRHRIVDRPGARRINLRPIPRSGGLAVAASFLFVAGVFLIVNDQANLIRVPASLRPLDVAALLLGGAVAAVLGALDDLFDLRARWQFLGQFALAAGAVALGIVIDFVNNPFGPRVIEFPAIIAIGFTIFWIMGMINSINWIDGLDGLSTGVSIIAAVTLGLISLSTRVPQPLIAVLCFILAGALLGFLRWNFYPARIFTGTSGVQFVGYTLAVLSILGTAKVAVALLVLGVPIIDTFWIIVRRLSQGRSPFTPDRQHIHHRLLDLGLSHRQTVLVIYGLCAAMAVLALVLTEASLLYTFLVVFFTAGLVLFVPTRGDFGRPDELEAEAYEPAPAVASAGPVASESIPPGRATQQRIATKRAATDTVPPQPMAPGPTASNPTDDLDTAAYDPEPAVSKPG
jgi:UDP-GlcNAc:undecaprenyl-phosphate GlcNAc-1-phosphate transferase